MTQLANLLHLNGSCISMWEINEPRNIYSDTNPVMYFRYLLKGQTTISTKNEHLTLNPGDLLVFPTGIAHSTGDTHSDPISTKEFIKNQSEQRYQEEVGTHGRDSSTIILAAALNYKTSLFETVSGFFPPYVLLTKASVDDDLLLKGVLDMIVNLRCLEHNIFQTSVIYKLFELLLILCLSKTQLPVEQGAQPPAGKGATHHYRISQVCKLLEANYAQAWDLQTLAKNTAMSESTLLKAFKRVTGLTPYQYLVNIRLNTAYNLIENSDLPLDSIAEHVGYNSFTSFFIAFKKMFAINPSAIRKAVSGTDCSVGNTSY